MNPQVLSQAIGKVESGGDYAALGKPVQGGDRAYGKYQVMGANIPSWTQEATGTAMSPQQFLQSPQAQDLVAQHKIGQLYQQYKNPQDVASAWFSGRPLSHAGNASDVNGTSVPTYVKNVMQALGGGVAEAATTGNFQPLSPQQFQKAQQAGFSTQQIIQFEQRRKQEMGGSTQPSSQGGGFDLGSLLDVGLPIAGTIAGGIIGGAAGAPAFGVGALAGGAVGAGLGATAGTSLANIFDQLTGRRQLTPLQAAGEPLLTGAVTAASGGIGEALGASGGLAGVASRVGAQSGLGAAFGAGNAALHGRPQDIGTQAGIGALFGGTAGVAGEALNSIVGQSAAGGLPRHLTEEALPKLSTSDQAKGVVDTIMNFKPGGIESLLNQAEQGIRNTQSQIEPLLAEADQLSRVGPAISGQDVAQTVLDRFPNSGWDASYVQSALKRIAPQESATIDKLFSTDINGGLSASEADSLKKALYASSGISRAFRNMTDPRLLADKGLGTETALALADAVKATAPGTEDLFAQQGKFLAARNLLEKLSEAKTGKILSFPAILAGLGGAAVGGLHGSLAAAALERAYESPSVKLGLGNILNRVGQSGAFQSASTAATPVKIQLLKALLNSSIQTTNQ